MSLLLIAINLSCNKSTAGVNTRTLPLEETGFLVRVSLHCSSFTLFDDRCLVISLNEAR